MAHLIGLESPISYVCNRLSQLHSYISTCPLVLAVLLPELPLYALRNLSVSLEIQRRRRDSPDGEQTSSPDAQATEVLHSS